MCPRNLILFFVLSIVNITNAYEYLWVQDPRGWESGQGTIEDATISVRPRGVYFEYGLYLTFSAEGLYFYNTDTLEVILDFGLPKEAIIHDSWLWIGDEIVQGKLLDKWTASQIYEDVVRRRRDPSVLYKQYVDEYSQIAQYELRIFPMAMNETRKVKISYLMPAEWTSHLVSVALPTSILRTSLYPVPVLSVLTWAGPEWKNPRILELPTTTFEERFDAKYGNYSIANLPSEKLQADLAFAVDAPLDNGLYLNYYGSEQDCIYQLVFLPSDVLEINTTQKVAILLDYDAANSSHTTSDILNALKPCIQSYLKSTDSFNLIFSRLNIARISEQWLPADSSTIENAFSQLSENPTTNYSNLAQLIANGIDFVKTNGNDGILLLLSNSDQVGDFQAANPLITELLSFMNPVFPIHVGDFQNQNWDWYDVGGRYYMGNEYFYSNISQLTSGNYFKITDYSDSPSGLLSSLFESLGGFLGSFDLHTTLENGFCYGRYSSNEQNQSTYLNKPILQIGKFAGLFPFVIEASGIYQSEMFSETFRIDQANAFQTDSLSEEMWTGKCIQTLESEQQTNDVVSEIIDYSLNERILSLYTAFLCLEHRQGGQVLSNPWDESELPNDVQSDKFESKKDTLFQAFPNPFNSKTVIKIKLKSQVDSKFVSFKIYNILGQVIQTFEPDIDGNQNQFELMWDGKNQFGQDVSTGSYIFVMSMPNKRQSLKLLLMK